MLLQNYKVFFQKENGEIINQLDLGGQSRGLVGFAWERFTTRN